MSLSALLDRLESEVTSVPAGRVPERTVKSMHNQCGSPSSPGSLEYLDMPGSVIPRDELNDRQEVPVRAWLIRHADGSLISHHFIPPATESEIRAWYPQAISVEVEEQRA